MIGLWIYLAIVGKVLLITFESLAHLEKSY